MVEGILSFGVSVHCAVPLRFGFVSVCEKYDARCYLHSSTALVLSFWWLDTLVYVHENGGVLRAFSRDTWCFSRFPPVLTAVCFLSPGSMPLSCHISPLKGLYTTSRLVNMGFGGLSLTLIVVVTLRRSR